MTRFALLLAALCLFAGPTLHAQTVASCPTATAGSNWATGAWLPCTPGATYIAQPIPASAIINDMRCPLPAGTPGTCTFSWQLSTAVLPTDQVWVQTTAAPAGTWVMASTLNLPSAIIPVSNPNTAILTWVAPTTTAAGAPLPAGIALTYNVYRGMSATTLTKLTNVSALTYTDPAGSTTPTTYFYAVTATCSTCTESAESAIVSKTIVAAALKTAAPSGLTTN